MNDILTMFIQRSMKFCILFRCATSVEPHKHTNTRTHTHTYTIPYTPVWTADSYASSHKHAGPAAPRHYPLWIIQPITWLKSQSGVFWLGHAVFHFTCLTLCSDVSDMNVCTRIDLCLSPTFSLLFLVPFWPSFTSHNCIYILNLCVLFTLTLWKYSSWTWWILT